MVDKVVNDKYYGKVNKEKFDRRRLYFPYTIAFFSFSFMLLTVSVVLNY